MHGIGNHFVVVFDDDNRSPEANHVEVGTSTHQAGFGNGCALGTFAYAVATFGLHITDNCIGHCNDRVETCPCIGKVFAQGCHLEVGELGSSPATEVIVGTVTAQRHDGAGVEVEPCTVVKWCSGLFECIVGSVVCHIYIVSFGSTFQK